LKFNQLLTGKNILTNKYTNIRSGLGRKALDVSEAEVHYSSQFCANSV